MKIFVIKDKLVNEWKMIILRAKDTVSNEH